MNYFNSLQAVAIYTATPFGIQWLMSNHYEGWAAVFIFGQLVGFIALTFAVNDSIK